MRCETPLVKEDLHHPTLDIMLIDINISSFLSPPRIVKLFHKADYKIINELLANIDWSVISDYYDIDTSVEKFYYIINDIITKNIPSKVHKKWKMYDNYSDYSTFKLLRDRQKRVEKTCYDNYLDFAENNILRNSKCFWTFVKTKQNTNDIPERLYYNDISTSDGQQISNLVIVRRC
ncbi:uncharacterized protein LOC126779821 [Nymphalis io]|uniref:uncharacterized protein LOC126779821 n=1 Tax=Inachis io TaxID=171585 RepID=UPI0021682728|nr:uncharacterized protein LOC126779821 [Nymphalis io]